MHETLLFVSQAVVIVSSMVGCALIISVEPQKRIAAFSIFLFAAIPDLYISVSKELWIFVAIVPYYIVFNVLGLRNNLKELKDGRKSKDNNSTYEYKGEA